MRASSRDLLFVAIGIAISALLGVALRTCLPINDHNWVPPVFEGGPPDGATGGVL